MLNNTLFVVAGICLRCLCFYAISLLLYILTPCGYLKKTRFNLAGLFVVNLLDNLVSTDVKRIYSFSHLFCYWLQQKHTV